MATIRDNVTRLHLVNPPAEILMEGHSLRTPITLAASRSVEKSQRPCKNIAATFYFATFTGMWRLHASI